MLPLPKSTRPRPLAADELRRLRIAPADLVSAALVPLPAGAWALPALSGRLVELSSARGEAVLSLAFTLVLDAQRRGEGAVWIGPRSGCFFPPDAAEMGVDLDALAVVHAAGAREIAKAADWTARSGAFGLIVLDLAADQTRDLPAAAQSRLLSLAQKHAIAVVSLTRKTGEQRSASSLVSLRAQAVLRRLAEDPSDDRADDRFACELDVLKDKTRSLPWRHVEVRRGPPGLR